MKSCFVLRDYDDERNKTVFHKTTSHLQDQDQSVQEHDHRPIFWSQTGLALRPHHCQRPPKNLLGIAEAGCFTERMPFLSQNRQCQSTVGEYNKHHSQTFTNKLIKHMYSLLGFSENSNPDFPKTKNSFNPSTCQTPTCGFNMAEI